MRRKSQLGMINNFPDRERAENKWPQFCNNFFKLRNFRSRNTIKANIHYLKTTRNCIFVFYRYVNSFIVFYIDYDTQRFILQCLHSLIITLFLLAWKSSLCSFRSVYFATKNRWQKRKQLVHPQQLRNTQMFTAQWSPTLISAIPRIFCFIICTSSSKYGSSFKCVTAWTNKLYRHQSKMSSKKLSYKGTLRQVFIRV